MKGAFVHNIKPTTIVFASLTANSHSSHFLSPPIHLHLRNPFNPNTIPQFNCIRREKILPLSNLHFELNCFGRELNCVTEKMVVIDTHIVGIFVFSLLGFVLFFSLFRGLKLKKAGEKRSFAGIKSEVVRSSDELCSVSDDPDVIIVGAGVAGAALAYTLAKISCFAQDKFIHILALLMYELVQKKVLIFTNTTDVGFRVKLFLEKASARSLRRIIDTRTCCALGSVVEKKESPPCLKRFADTRNISAKKMASHVDQVTSLWVRGRGTE